MSRKWSQEEDAILLNNFYKMTLQRVSELLPGRTAIAVGRRARKLGMKYIGNKKAQKSRAIHRFYENISKTSSGCWKWNGTLTNDGYGILGSLGSPVLAHRFSWEMHNHERVPDGMVVMHSCDNPCCCNPDHLQIGTPLDNTRDMYEKGRNVLPQRKERKVVISPDKGTLRVAIYGTSTVKKRDIADAAINSGFFSNDSSCVVSSGRNRAERLLESWATREGVSVYYPNITDMSKRGSSTLPYSDALIFAWDGESIGGASTLREARERGLSVFIWNYIKKSEDSRQNAKSKWYKPSIATIEQVVTRAESVNPQVTNSELRREISKAYPFGERKGRCYSVWRDCVNDCLRNRHQDFVLESQP